MQYESLTTDGVYHDEANMLTEFIWLNRNIRAENYPWRGSNGREWGAIVGAIKKLMGPSFGLSAQQIAFYIWRCRPQRINPKEFARMAVVARRLFEPLDIEEVSRLYKDRQREMASSGLEQAKYKKDKPKSLLSFLRELENGKSN
jgi:hypothetical protein